MPTPEWQCIDCQVFIYRDGDIHPRQEDKVKPYASPGKDGGLPGMVIKRWLKEQISLEKAESHPLVDSSRYSWINFKQQIIHNDQLWKFESPLEKSGFAGFCIVRDEEVVDSFITEEFHCE